jgi:hypothetical protein
MIDAKDGFALDINGSQIELYLYDLNLADDDVKKFIKNARSTGELNLLGTPVPVVMNGNVLLTGHDAHPDKDKIIEVFKSFN